MCLLKLIAMYHSKCVLCGLCVKGMCECMCSSVSPDHFSIGCNVLWIHLISSDGQRSHLPLRVKQKKTRHYVLLLRNCLPSSSPLAYWKYAKNIVGKCYWWVLRMKKAKSPLVRYRISLLWSCLSSSSLLMYWKSTKRTVAEAMMSA